MYMRMYNTPSREISITKPKKLHQPLVHSPSDPPILSNCRSGPQSLHPHATTRTLQYWVLMLLLLHAVPNNCCHRTRQRSRAGNRKKKHIQRVGYYRNTAAAISPIQVCIPSSDGR